MKSGGKRKFRSILPWWQPYIFILPFFIVYLAFQLYPVIYSFMISLTKWNGFGTQTFVGFENYKRLLSDGRFYQSLGNTVLYMLIPIPILIILGLVLANLMTSTFVKGKRLYQIATFLPYLLSSVAVGILYGILFDERVGPINKVLTALGLVNEGIPWLNSAKYVPFVLMFLIIWRNLGFYMIMMIAGITNIPSELYDAAAVDGANAVQIFFKITIPQMRNMIVFVTLQGIIGGFQLLEEPMMLLTGVTTGGAKALAGGPERSALTMMWYMYDTGFGTKIDFGYSTTIAFGVFVVIVACSAVLFKVLNGREGDDR